MQFGFQSKSDSLKNNQLIAAIFNGKTSTVRKLLQLGANPNCLDEIGILDNKMQPALIVAIDWRMRMTEGHMRIPGYFPGYPPKENVEIIHELIDRGANVHVRNQIGCTPMMLAAWQGKNNTIKLLLKYDKMVNAQSKDGSTAIMLAIASHHLTTIKILLRNGADINNIHDIHGYTCLTLAEVRKDEDIIKVIEDFQRNSKLPKIPESKL